MRNIRLIEGQIGNDGKGFRRIACGGEEIGVSDVTAFSSAFKCLPITGSTPQQHHRHRTTRH